MNKKQMKSTRDALGLSQAALAKALGVTRNTVNRWEMGLHPVPEIAVKLIKTLAP